MLKILKKFGLSLADLITVYVGYIRPLTEYAAPVWHAGLTDTQSASLERIQKRCCKIMLGNLYSTYVDALELCNLITLKSRREKLCHTFATSLMQSDEFRHWLPPSRASQHNLNLRSGSKLSIPKWSTKRYRNSPIPYFVQLLNTTL